MPVPWVHMRIFASICLLLLNASVLALDFQTAAHYSTTERPVGLAAADFDRDGRLDLLCGSQDSNSILLMRGNGDGSFVAGVVISAGHQVAYVCAGDFDRDGNPDAAICSSTTDKIAFLR